MDVAIVIEDIKLVTFITQFITHKGFGMALTQPMQNKNSLFVEVKFFDGKIDGIYKEDIIDCQSWN